MWRLVTTTVVVPQAIVLRISAQRQRFLPAETGGFLLGMRRGRHLEVTDMTEQKPLDSATRFSFERRDPAHARQIEGEWRQSNALVSVIGDWHTHPFGPGDASGTDRKAWRVLARTARQPIIGLIDAGTPLPTLFWTRNAALLGSTKKLTLTAVEGEDLAFSF